MKNIILFFLLSCSSYYAQSPDTGTLEGVVTLRESGSSVKNATVTVSQLGRSVLTDATGRYQLTSLPFGKYEVIVHLDRMADVVNTVNITSAIATENFEISVNSIREEVTVTSSGSLESINNSYQAVSTVGAIQIAAKNPISIGDALDNEPGVTKRSFGPGSGRPVIRGFDGDRVLILQDGLRVGGISSQSADEVEPIDVMSLDRIEVVKGPATLLYGSNAIGGVVNGISTNDVYQSGPSGYITAFGGTTNGQVGGSAGIKYGFRNFIFFANAGAGRTNDYVTPVGSVKNSFARNSSLSGGSGWFGRNGWISFTYTLDRRNYGIPAETGAVDFEHLKMRRDNYQIKGGLKELKGPIESIDFGFSYNDYRHTEFEFESDENVTEIDAKAANKNANYRLNLDQRRRGKYSGAFGFSGFTRDYESTGAEAPAPRTKQNSVAVYGLERIDSEHIGFQFGGRVEQSRYEPAGDLPSRNFIGFSGGAALRVPTWKGGSFVANYQHSFRVPALEELYDNGPHPGILVFDIGNSNLKAEQGDGVDVSLRHRNDRFRLDTSVFYYNIRNFVYPAFTGSTDPKSNLLIVAYEQGNSRYFGGEASVEAKLRKALWLNGKIDFVRAELYDLNKSLPRIPPLRGTLGLDWSHKGFSVRPELIIAARQRRVFDNESQTNGFAVINVNGSYTFVKNRVAHVFSVSGFNLSNTLYRNHLSFIKAFAPEIGRGVRVNYSLRF